MFIVNQTPYVKHHKIIRINNARILLCGNLFIIIIRGHFIVYKNWCLVGSIDSGRRIHTKADDETCSNTRWNNNEVSGHHIMNQPSIPFYYIDTQHITLSIYGFKVYQYKTSKMGNKIGKELFNDFWKIERLNFYVNWYKFELNN